MNGKLGLIHVILTKKVCLAPDCLPAVSRALFELSLLENKPSGEGGGGGRRGEIRKDKVPAHATVILAEESRRHTLRPLCGGNRTGGRRGSSAELRQRSRDPRKATKPPPRPPHAQSSAGRRVAAATRTPVADLRAVAGLHTSRRAEGRDAAARAACDPWAGQGGRVCGTEGRLEAPLLATGCGQPGPTLFSCKAGLSASERKDQSVAVAQGRSRVGSGKH